MTAELKVAVTGTFRTGKSLITQALAIITGMAPVRAAKSFYWASKHFTGKQPERFTLNDCFQLDIINLIELAVREHNIQGGFWSDGELIQRFTSGLLQIHQYRHPGHKKNPLGKVCLGGEPDDILSKNEKSIGLI